MRSERLGLIAPHPPVIVREVGGPRADVTFATRDALSVAARMLLSFAADTVVVISPHAPGMSDAFAVDGTERVSGDLSAFGAPRVALSYPTDVELASAILERLDRAGLPAADRAAFPHLKPGVLDHGVVVPLSFLLPDRPCPVVILSPSHLPLDSHLALGRSVAAAADALGRRVAMVASGDCSHRLSHDGPYPFSAHGPQLDSTIRGHVAASDLAAMAGMNPTMVEEGGECGVRSFVTLGGFLGEGVFCRELAYEAPWGVGYLTAVAGDPAWFDGRANAAEATRPDGVAEDALVALARAAILAKVREGVTLGPAPFDDPELPDRAGTFVSLHIDGELRGCMGTIVPHEDDLAAEVVRNAVEAATRDPRFPPLTPEELGSLEVKVDVLGPSEVCTFADLDPREYGVVVTSGWRRGLLLPDLEGVDTSEKQVVIALRKAGIDPGEDYTLERFRVTRHG